MKTYVCGICGHVSYTRLGSALHQLKWCGPKTMTFWAIVLGLWVLTGCSTVKGPPELTDYSDAGALTWSNNVLATWSPAAGDLLAYGSAISAAGLTTGTLFAAGTGSPAVTGLALGSAMLQWITSILKPNERNNALMEGAIMVREAVAKYFTNKTAAGISKTPADCMTAYAGVLVAEVNIAQNRVAFLDQKRMPIDPKPPTDAAGQRTAAAPVMNTCGR